MIRVRALASGAFPTAEAALAAGEITVEHLDHLIRFHASLSAAVHPDVWAGHEPNLVAIACEHPPLRFARALHRAVGPRLDPDGYLPSEKELTQPQNRLHLTWCRNGRLLFHGELDHEVAVLFTAYLEPYLTRRPAAEDGVDLRSIDGLYCPIEGGPDLLPVSVSEARRLACDCRIVPITLSVDSLPLDIGQATRTIPAHIRRSVVDRDQGCAFPGV
jgi:hypothetical protein